NDLATFEIFWHSLWMSVQRNVTLTDDTEGIQEGDAWNKIGYSVSGPLSAKGQKVDKTLMKALLDQRRAAVRKYFEMHPENPRGFNRELADVTMDIMERMLTHSVYIPWGSRLVFSVLDKPKEQRDQILDAVFSANRAIVEAKVQSGVWDKEALK